MPGSRAPSRGSCTPKPFLYGDVLVRAAEQSRIPGLPVQSLTSRAVAPARDCVGNPMDLSCFKPGLCMNPGRTFFSKNDDGRVVAYTGMSQPNHPGRIGETRVTLLAGRNSRPRSRGRGPTPKVSSAGSSVSPPAFDASHFRELIATMPPKLRRVKSKSPPPSLPAKSYKQVLWDEVSKAPGFRVLGPLVGAVEGFAGSGKTAFLVAIAAKYPTSVFVQCTLRSRSADWPCFKSSNHDKRPLKVPLWIVDEANRCSTTAEYVKAALATSTPLVLVYDRLQCETYDWLLGPAPNYLWRTYRLSPGPISDALVARYPKLQVLGQDRVPCVLPLPDADEESCLLPVAGVDGFSTNFVQLLTKQHPHPSFAFVWLYAADLVCRALGGAVWSVIEALVYSTTHVPLLGLAIKVVFGAQFSFLLFAFAYVVQFYAVTSWVHFGVPVFYTLMWVLARVLSVTVTQCPYHDVTCSARDCPAFSWLRSTITGSTDFNYAHLQGETVDEGHIHLNKFVLRNPHLLLISLTRLRRGIVFSATPLEKMKLPDFIEKRACLPSGAFKWKLREHVPKGVRSTPTRPNLMRRQWVPPGANRLGRAILPYGANDIRTENSMWNLWSLATLWLSYPAAVLFFT